jgi:uncharacterized protein
MLLTLTTRRVRLRDSWSRSVVPSLTVTEICHLLADPQRRGRADLAAEFCGAVAVDELRVIEATPHDDRRMAELLTTYASLRLQVVDACIVALAERLDLREVAAQDRRDLLVVARGLFSQDRCAARLFPRRSTAYCREVGCRVPARQGRRQSRCGSPLRAW